MSQEVARKMISGIFKALGHPTRLAIVMLLRGGERCVCEIVEELGSEQQSNVSQHLAVLRGEGLLASRKEGLNVHYRLRHPEVLDLVQVAERLLLRELEATRKSLGNWQQEQREE
ncbi:MAG: helix-turn-helix transcriptional regulator [Firmicutes bacterium]|nr:helix-turn-helix transcriptional regulator [Bacillota bacterium]